MPTHLLTWHGTVLCQQRGIGTLVHRPVADPGPDVDLFAIEDPTGILQVNIGHFLRNDDTLSVTLNGGPLTGWTLHRQARSRSLMMSRDGSSMIADPHTGGISVAQNEPGPEAFFVAIGAEDLAALRDVLASRWVAGSGGAATMPAHGQLHAGCRLTVGAMSVDIAWSLPFDRSQWPLRLPVFVEGWRIDCIYRYRPLIYYAVFGDEAMFRQLRHSLATLADHAGYDGAVVVMTDRTPEEIHALRPPNGNARVVILPTVASDRIASMGARLTIAQWADCQQFQPVLYVDADTIFDRPIEPMLRAIMLSDRISAVPEPSQTLGQSDMVGAGLLRADGHTPATDEPGINSGILGIPNLQTHKHTLDTMARVLHQRLAICGRDSSYGDQPIINYVGTRLGVIDSGLIAPFVRLSSAAIEPDGRQGIVHFCWVPGSANKADAMEAYRRKLNEPA